MNNTLWALIAAMWISQGVGGATTEAPLADEPPQLIDFETVLKQIFTQPIYGGCVLCHGKTGYWPPLYSESELEKAAQQEPTLGNMAKMKQLIYDCVKLDSTQACVNPQGSDHRKFKMPPKPFAVISPQHLSVLQKWVQTPVPPSR